MDKEQLIKFREEFSFQVEKKPSHGKNEIKALFIICMNNVLLNHTEYNK